MVFILYLKQTPELIKIDPFVEFGYDHDIKGFGPDLNITIDGYMPGGSIATDESNGGTDDGSGKCRHDSGLYTIEMTFPLASNDTLGKDFNLTIGSQIDFLVLLFKDGSAYTQLHEGDFDYCTLHILPRTNLFGIRVFALVASLLSSLLMVIVYRRKRN